MDKALRQKIKVYQRNNELNHKDASRFLLGVSELFDSCEVQHWLVFGTALAACRDKKFISHDLDIDVAIFHDDADKIVQAIKETSYQLVRQTKEILTIVADKIPMDIYMFELKNEKYQCMKYSIPQWPLDESGTVAFCGRTFNTVSCPTAYFDRLYGLDWKTPKKGHHAQQ